MSNSIIIKKKIKNFTRKIIVSGDKSISIRWVLFASLASGKSQAKNLLMDINTKRGLISIVKILEPWLDLFWVYW